MKNRHLVGIALLALITLTACDRDKISDTSIFANVPVLDSASYTYPFDKFLYDSLLVPYNIAFQYKLGDETTDMDYNLVPCKYDLSKQVACAVKYLWNDVYAKQINPEFLKLYAPRIINVLGSPAINAEHGTEVLGVAEGGVKITLYNMNGFDLKNMAWMNQYIFHVMHHEFSHILHQTKSFPKEYERISAGKYDSQGWQYHTDEEAYSMGFVTPYSMAEAHEDFVEVISSYITDTRAVWAKRGFEMAEDHTHIVSVNEDQEGTSTIQLKINYCKTWLLEKYNYSLDSIRAEVQRRQDNMTEEVVMNQLYKYYE